MKKRGAGQNQDSENFRALFRRTFLYICVGVLLPLTLVCAAAFLYLNNIYNDELRSVSLTSLRRITSMADMVQTSIDRVAVNLTSAENIAEFVETPKKSTARSYGFYSLANGVSGELNQLTGAYIGTIYIYSFVNGYVVTGGNETMSADIMSDRSWLDPFAAGDREHAASWTSGRADEKGGVVLSSYYSLPFEWLQKPVGVIVMNMRGDWLESLVEESTEEGFADFYILDGSGNVLYNRDPAKLGASYGELPLPAGLGEIRVESRDTGRSYVACSSFDSLNGRVTSLGAAFAAALAICVCVAVLVSYIISVRVFKPIRSIIKLKESHSELLQAQINPHFLYNALQTISFQAVSLTKSDNVCSRSIIRLSELFRGMTEVEGESDVGSEIDFALKYLEVVSSARPGDYAVTSSIAGGAGSVPLPKLTVQPLVENCVKHAFRGAQPPYRINISAAPRGRDVVVVVSDNGRGQSAEWIRETNSELAACADGSGTPRGGGKIGLRNVNARIKLTCGTRCGVTVSANASGGLDVSLRLPGEGGEKS